MFKYTYFCQFICVSGKCIQYKITTKYIWPMAALAQVYCKRRAYLAGSRFKKILVNGDDVTNVAQNLEGIKDHFRREE